jgi:hypothetical protein
MSERPFFLSPAARKPDTEVNDVTAAIGGPVLRDRAHFFGAYELVDRSLVTGTQVITVTPATASRLGIDLPSGGVIPANQSVNVTLIRGAHGFKAGLDAQFIADERVRGERFEYTFASVDSYLAARAGTNARGYTTFRQDFGDLAIDYDSAFYGLFIQDDWQITDRMKQMQLGFKFVF